MSTTPSTSTIVGVFRDRAIAEQAMESLQHAGFDRDQIRYAGPGTIGSFFDDIKSLFTGPNTPGNALVNDLSNMGLSDEEAQYYANEYNNGNSIIAVKAIGREQEAANILQGFGAYHYSTMPGGTETANHTQQPSDYARSGDNTVGNEDAFTQQHNIQPGEVQETAGIAEEPPFSENEPGVATMEHDNNTAPQSMQPEASTTETEYDTAPQNTQPVVATTEPDTVAQNMQHEATTTGYDTAPQNGQPEVVPSEYDTTPQNPQPEAYTTEYDTAPQSTQPDTVPTEYDSAPQYSQPDTVPTEYDTGVQSSQVNVVQSGHEAELQDLLMQIQTTQQQLQEAKAQLQAAKEQADQLKAAREREVQLQEAREQLQEVQSELQATLAELRKAQEDIAQHQ